MVTTMGAGIASGGVQTVRTTAPAKLNLTLRVLGRMTSGFHRIETVIVPIDLHDDIELRIESGDGVSCSVELLPILAQHVAALPGSRPVREIEEELSAPTNLAARAVERYLAHTAQRARVSISISKRIPFEAGLGGGSADAAAALRAVARVLPPAADLDLISVAAEIGSDVPALVAGGAVLARGRGQLVTLLDPVDSDAALQRARVVIIKPPVGGPTAAAYSRFGLEASPEQDALERETSRSGALSVESQGDLQRLGLRASRHLFLREDGRLTSPGVDVISEVPFGSVPDALGQLFATLGNDFEKVVLSGADVQPSGGRAAADRASIARTLSELGAGRVLLAGSGSAVAAFFPDDDTARRAVDAICNKSRQNAHGARKVEVVPGDTFIVKARFLLARDARPEGGNPDDGDGRQT